MSKDPIARPVAMFCLWSLAAAPATRPAGPLPHVAVDINAHTVRVDCEAVAADYPLEFLAVVTNGNEYEAVVRSPAKPSDVHLGLLMIGLKPGAPVRYSEATQTWLPPSGPPVDVWFEYQKDGRLKHVPAYRWMRDVKTGKEARPFTWVFTGSKVESDRTYAADATGSMIGVINNENSVLDVPDLRGRAIEARDYERNPALVPPTGTPVVMILSPAAAAPAPPAATRPAEAPRSQAEPAARKSALSDVHINQPKVDDLQAYWDHAVAPHRTALRDAAQAHYQVISDLRHEQQRLVDEADRIQRTIDDLEKQYADMTTPQPLASTQP